ncbi:hypothetical protein HK098_001136 [Nowakowskiella sp. JEL0407]|nr:hypothetical protein HK098_001136 [Nowakowskiella sp. JEL0407]
METVPQLEPLFTISHLAYDEFVLIWNLCDIKGTGRLNKEQFIIFSHILAARRRGKQIPTGLPLSIKESFLKEDVKKSNVYVRPSTTTKPKDMQSEISSLQTDLDLTSDKVRSSKHQSIKLEQEISDLKAARDELTDTEDYYKRKQEALEDENAELSKIITGKRSSGGLFGAGVDENPEVLLSELKSHQSWLENRKRETLQLLDQIKREIDAES